MAGYALSSALVFAIVTRVNWRHILLAGVFITVLGNITSMYLHGYAELAGFRFLAGIGAGLLMNVTIVSIGLTTNFDRNYGFWAVTQLIVGAAGLYLLPGRISVYGLAAPFLAVAILALLVLPLANSFPEHGRDAGAAPDRHNRLLSVSRACLAYSFTMAGREQYGLISSVSAWLRALTPAAWEVFCRLP